MDADETTYGLHIILRFELEQELLFGGLGTADLPEAWNARMEELVASARRTTGSAASRTCTGRGHVRVLPDLPARERALRADLGAAHERRPDAYEQVEQGSFGEIHEWLRERLYRHGRKFTPAATIDRLVGGPIDPEPYLRYLAEKNASLAPV